MMPGSHLYSFSKDILGFLMTTESQDLGLTSHPKDGSVISFYTVTWKFLVSRARLAGSGVFNYDPCFMRLADYFI